MTDLCNTENTDADEEFGTQSPIIDVKEQRRKKDRDRYARMTNEEKQEKLKRRREAYQQSKTIKDLTQLHKKCTGGGMSPLPGCAESGSASLSRLELCRSPPRQLWWSLSPHPPRRGRRRQVPGPTSVYCRGIAKIISPWRQKRCYVEALPQCSWDQ